MALTLTYSIADQNFAQTKSLGILNLSLQMLESLARRPEFKRIHVLSNSSLTERLRLPANIPASLHDSAIRTRIGRIAWDQTGVYTAARKRKNEWLFLPKGFASFLRPCPVKLATCVADANHDYYKKHFPTEVPFLERWYFDFGFRATIKYSRVIFTISEFTAREVARVAKGYGFTPPPIRPIGIGFFRPEKFFEKRPRILVLTGRWPHKRTDLAVRYMARWHGRGSFPGTIEWVGGLPPGFVFPRHERWIRHQRLPDAEFKQLKGEALALVYFSDYEGFGMPPVEAAIMGTCPVYSDLPVTREIMGGAGYAFENASYESFERALDQALRCPPARVRAWGDELLRRHCWEAVAERVVQGLLETRNH